MPPKKSESLPYVIFYPHTREISERNWNSDYCQVVSIDPGTKNFALRIERRYTSGKVVPIVFDKASLNTSCIRNGEVYCEKYRSLSIFLNKYLEFYDLCHFIIIEKQLPQNSKATRLAQHTISYFSTILCDKPLLPSIIEVDAKLKGKMLGAPKGINSKQLKAWSVVEARRMLEEREDSFSIGVLNYFSKKQDDLCDTVCQAEALFRYWEP